MTELEKLIELLSAMHEDNMDCGIAQMLFEKLDWSKMPEVEDVFGNLYHYWHDEDIREKEEEYKLMQENELGKLISLLKHGDYENASNISFLHESKNS
ncbi:MULTISPECIES: hypothetical protein [Shewanella]|uniref:Uncharacterized protein n=1 Tax=Shewanella marisflavi TaxID=260364 RepID=A0ABX5WR41_9GAMM|nr:MULTISPECIES: hypothetical protein [Shewanella]QDF76949.1 hypothetical protein FGA12_18240 [Shewanella marisflavi]